MVLNLQTGGNLFDHSEKFDQGLGNVRRGAGTVIVALDGTGDATSIQDGIDLLPSTGGVVYIKEGTYIITTGIKLNIANTRIEGAGYATNIQTVNNVTMINITKADCGVRNVRLTGDRTKASNIGISIFTSVATSIEGVRIDTTGSDGITINSDNIRIRDCSIYTGAGRGIYLVGSANAFVNNCLIHGCDDEGIYLSGCYNCIISNSVIMSCDKHGISLSAGNRSIINGNILRDNDNLNTATYDGISLSASDENVISNNRCQDNDRYEINISNNTCDKNIIIGNQCVGTNHVGAINDAGTNTHPNGASGTTNLALDDLNIII